MASNVVDRVIYEKNPLDKVICQARFPTILKIEAEVPSAFQERLLPDYVDLTERQEVVGDVRVAGKVGGGTDEVRQITGPTVRNYEFATEDGRWRINLTRNFLALSTGNYVRWEEFRGRLEAALQAFVDVYYPVAFTRVGLRYVDIIVRSKLGLDGVDWRELVAKPLLGVLASDGMRDAVKQFQTTFLIELGEEGLARVTAGTIRSAQSGESCFMIDSDYYDLKRKKADEVLSRVGDFHSKAFSLFRWCITERLHTAMGPERLDVGMRRDE